MKGPTKKPNRIRLGWLERFITLAGLLVLLGVWMESGRELTQAIISRTWPRQEAVGGALVVIGVFAEVAIGLFIARSAKRAELKANEEITEARERIANAEQATAEANLARVQLEQHIASRRIFEEEIDAMAETLKPFTGQRAEVDAFPDTSEATSFAFDCWRVLKKAGWNVKLADFLLTSSPRSKRSSRATGILVETTADEESKRAGTALLKTLPAVSGGAGAMMPGSLQDMDPLVRLTVGEPPGIARTRTTRPVTPPQA